MEFNIKRETILSGIQKTLGIVERKTTLPILNNILIRTEKDRIKIIASDREISLIADYEAEIMEDGDITISARKLYDMVREIQGDDINFTVKDNNIATVKCLKTTYKIPGISADEYPSVADDQDIGLFKIKGEILKKLINKTSFAMSNDEIRKNLNGVLFEIEKDDGSYQVKLVSTDGHRLAIAYKKIDEINLIKFEKGIIIPRKGLGEIRKIVEDEKDYIEIGVYQGMCIVKTKNAMLKVRLIDAEYPDYHRVIPTETGIMVNLNKEKVLHALKRMSVVSSETYSSVIMTLKEDKIILNSTNPDIGEATDEVDVMYHGHDHTVGFNVKYLIDAIEVIEEDEVFFEIGIEKKPCIVRPVGNDNYLCIIMPLQI